jgi:uncharacterized protein
MLFEWKNAKRRANLKIHKLDFRDAPEVFDGPTLLYEDDRFRYGEQRFVTLDTETPEKIRIISFRKATRHEEAYLFKSLQN